MSEKKQIEEMTEILKDYTKKNNIMASVVILEAYAEELYKSKFRKQREGTWIDMEYYMQNKRIYKCSACSKSEAKDSLMSADFCPNCGAKMIGGAE